MKSSPCPATLFALPAILVFYITVAAVWQLPVWVAGLYLALSAAAFVAYAADKAAAANGTWRSPESSLHVLAFAGGWPGSLLARLFLRHQSTKQKFRQVFWATVRLNVAGFVLLASPVRQSLLHAR